MLDILKPARVASSYRRWNNQDFIFFGRKKKFKYHFFAFQSKVQGKILVQGIFYMKPNTFPAWKKIRWVVQNDNRLAHAKMELLPGRLPSSFFLILGFKTTVQGTSRITPFFFVQSYVCMIFEFFKNKIRKG